MKFTFDAVLFMRAKTVNPYPIAERYLGLLNFLKGHHPSNTLDGLSATCPPDTGVIFHKMIEGL